MQKWTSHNTQKPWNYENKYHQNSKQGKTTSLQQNKKTSTINTREKYSLMTTPKTTITTKQQNNKKKQITITTRQQTKKNYKQTKRKNHKWRKRQLRPQQETGKRQRKNHKQPKRKTTNKQNDDYDHDYTLEKDVLITGTSLNIGIENLWKEIQKQNIFLANADASNYILQNGSTWQNTHIPYSTPQKT